MVSRTGIQTPSQTSPCAQWTNVPEIASSSHSSLFLPLAKNRPPSLSGSHSHRGYVLSLSSHITPAASGLTPPFLDSVVGSQCQEISAPGHTTLQFCLSFTTHTELCHLHTTKLDVLQPLPDSPNQTCPYLGSRDRGRTYNSLSAPRSQLVCVKNEHSPLFSSHRSPTSSPLTFLPVPVPRGQDT